MRKLEFWITVVVSIAASLVIAGLVVRAHASKPEPKLSELGELRILTAYQDASQAFKEAQDAANRYQAAFNRFKEVSEKELGDAKFPKGTDVKVDPATHKIVPVPPAPEAPKKSEAKK